MTQQSMKKKTASKPKKKSEYQPIKKLKDKQIVPAWDCGVINNEVVIKDREAFDRHLIPYEGMENLQLVLKKKVKPRSRQEEKFYRAVVVVKVAEALSITEDEAHEILKHLFLREEERSVLPDGKVIRYMRTMSTTELGDRAYRKFWEDVIRWAALPTLDEGLATSSGLGIYIPYPNEADWSGKEEYMMG